MQYKHRSNIVDLVVTQFRQDLPEGHSLQTYRKQNYRREKWEIGQTQLVGGINKIEIFCRVVEMETEIQKKKKKKKKRKFRQ